MKEFETLWSCSSASKMGAVKAKVIVDDHIGFTIVKEDDGTILTCCLGPLAPQFKTLRPAAQKHLLKHYPAIVEYANNSEETGVFNVDEMELRVFGLPVTEPPDKQNPTADNCAFNQ